MQNQQNWSFYDCMPRGTLATHYEPAAGLENYCDIKEIDRMLPFREVASVLELGAGEGRVIKGLRQMHYEGIIYAVERSSSLVDGLRGVTAQCAPCKLYTKNILGNENLPSADVALWLWAGIIEFSAEEQQVALKKLRHSVKNAFIDTPKLGAVTNATKGQGQDLELEASWGKTISAHIPLPEELDLYARKAGFELKHIQTYTTASHRKRVLYHLS